METYRFRQSELRVRLSAPHPLFLCILLFFFFFWASPEARAESLVYHIAQDTTLLEVVEEESDDGIMPLVDPLLGRLFNNRFLGIYSQRLVTQWNNWKITDSDNQRLAFEVFDLATGIDNAINEVEARVEGYEIAKNDLYDAVQISKNDDSIKTTTPNLLGLVTQNQNSILSYFKEALKNGNSYGGRDFKGNRIVGVSVADLLGISTYNQWGLYDRLDKELYSGRTAYVVPDFAPGSVSYNDILRDGTISDLLSVISENQNRLAFNDLSLFTSGGISYPMLYADGSTDTTGQYMTLFRVTTCGFAGIAQLLAGNGNRIVDFTVTDPEDPLNPDAGTYQAPSLFDAIGYWGTEELKLLTKLQFVLASDQDIDMNKQEEPNKNQAYEDFFGGGDGAVKPNDITTASGLTGGAKQIFSGAGSADQAFTAASSSDSYLFFSEEVAQDLDQVGQPVGQSDDDIFEGLVQDEDGFWSVGDSPMFDLDLYLQQKAGGR